jgi:hypothetical protein
MTKAIDPLQQPHVDDLEAAVREIMLIMDALFAEFATVQRNFLTRIDKLKARRDAILRELYQLTGDATVRRAARGSISAMTQYDPVSDQFKQIPSSWLTAASAAWSAGAVMPWRSARWARLLAPAPSFATIPRALSLRPSARKLLSSCATWSPASTIAVWP